MKLEETKHPTSLTCYFFNIAKVRIKLKDIKILFLSSNPQGEYLDIGKHKRRGNEEKGISLLLENLDNRCSIFLGVTVQTDREELARVVEDPCSDDSDVYFLRGHWPWT